MNKLTLKTTLAGSLVALSVSALAAAGDGSEHKPAKVGARAALVDQFFTKLDLNKDGKVTRKEAETSVQQLFAKLDKDKDGELTREEADEGALAMHKEALAARFKQRDKNKDGRLNAEEAEMPQSVFERLDTNKDNAVSLEEFATRPDFRAKSRGHQFELADKNKDGKVTRAEATEAAKLRFETADKDHDGVVTRAEFEERVEHVRTQRGKAPSHEPAK